MLRLLKLTLRERKWVTLALVSTLFVALFTAVFVNLVQPIIDEMFKPAAVTALAAPALSAAAEGPAAAGTGTKTRWLDFLWKALGVSKDDIKRVLPIVVVVVLFGKGFFTFLSSFFMKAVGNKIVKTMRDELYGHILFQSSVLLRPGHDGRPHVPADERRRPHPAGRRNGHERPHRGEHRPARLCSRPCSPSTGTWPWSPSSSPRSPSSPWPPSAASSRNRAAGARSDVRDLHPDLRDDLRPQDRQGLQHGRFERAQVPQNVRALLPDQPQAGLDLLAQSSPFMEFIGGIVGAFILYIGADRIAKGHLSAGDFGSFAAGHLLHVHADQAAEPGEQRRPAGDRLLDRIEEVLNVGPDPGQAGRRYPAGRSRATSGSSTSASPTSPTGPSWPTSISKSGPARWSPWSD